MTELQVLPPPNPLAVVFDLDGTLVESRTDLAIAVNHVRRYCNLPSLEIDVIRPAIGGGARSLVQQCLPQELQIRVDELMPEFHRFYNANCVVYTTALPGVIEVLERLQGRVKLAVLTNKPKAPSLTILRSLGLDRFFQEVVGGECFPTKKPDPEGIRWLLQRLDVPASRTVLVGDGVPDVEVARAAGVTSIAVLDGIGLPDLLSAAEPDYSISTMARLFSLPIWPAF